MATREELYEQTERVKLMESLSNAALFLPQQQMPDYEPTKVAALTLPEKPQPAAAVATEYDAEYAALAEKVGFSCPELLEQKLLNFLHEGGYHTYELERVERYMNSLAERSSLSNWQGMVWFWRPLRQSDVADTPYDVMRDFPRNPTPYDKPIPMPVLQTVADIAEKLPESRFYVTDLEREPDPFLGVKLRGMTRLIVIERWDEPSFR